MKNVKKHVKTLKSTKTFLKLPKNIKEAKNICRKICKQHKLRIIFDDKSRFRNTEHEVNACYQCDDTIWCSKFLDFNYDILVFGVLHEIGHTKQLSRQDMELNHNVIKPSDCCNRSKFSNEFDAWNYAINEYMELFNCNISIKLARYMMDCLNSYIIDYNDCLNFSKYGMLELECYFWCPIKRKILK